MTKSHLLGVGVGVLLAVAVIAVVVACAPLPGLVEQRDENVVRRAENMMRVANNIDVSYLAQLSQVGVYRVVDEDYGNVLYVVRHGGGVAMLLAP